MRSHFGMVFSCKFAAYFQNNFFPRTPLNGCFCTKVFTALAQSVIGHYLKECSMTEKYHLFLHFFITINVSWTSTRKAKSSIPIFLINADWYCVALYLQKESLRGVLLNRCFEKFLKIYRKNICARDSFQ